MSRLRVRLRQLTCRHWFDLQPQRDYSVGLGAIICGERKQYRITVEDRVCSKCGLTETRRIGDPVCEGWT